MFEKQLFGVVAETNVEIFEEYGYEIEIANEYLYSPKTTTIVAPQISPQYHIVHAPQLQFNSPSGTIGGAPVTQTATATGHEITDMLTPTQSILQEQAMSQQQEGGGIGGSGGGMMDYILIIAVVAIGAIFILPKLLKKKGKAKISTPAGIGGSVST